MADQNQRMNPYLTSPENEDRTVIKTEEELSQFSRSSLQYDPPYLVVIDGQRVGAHFPISQTTPNIIGRASDNAVRLDDQSVSRQHAQIKKTNASWTIQDMGSKNGTSINDSPVTDTVTIGHKDVFKVGIYQVRLVLEPLSAEDEMSIDDDVPVQSERTVFVSEADLEKEAVLMPSNNDLDNRDKQKKDYDSIPPVAIEKDRKLSPSNRIKWLLLVLVISAIICVGYLKKDDILRIAGIKTNNRAHVTQKKHSVKKKVEKKQQISGNNSVAANTNSNDTKTKISETIPVFLDCSSSPYSAQLMIEQQKIGMTPKRLEVDLIPGKTYEVSALFYMKDIDRSYSMTLPFSVKKGDNIIPLHFKAPIGTLKIMDLPRDVDPYLEGSFSYDRYKDHTVKMSEIVLKKPIYMPFGKYSFELRRGKKLGQTATTMISSTIFKREFDIAEESPAHVLTILEDDLSQFPVIIRSDPNNAHVFIDGQRMGKTPYQGNFPFGRHVLTLQKEGYNEHSEKLDIDINIPYEANVTLVTSIAGTHLNRAKHAMNRKMYQDAINELAEALNSKPAASETALAYYRLGLCYLHLNDIQKSKRYFELARENPMIRHKAMLGLVNVYAIMNDISKALPPLVEVMLKTTDNITKSMANELFQKISPFRSILYVYSDPSGAIVTVNDKKAKQQTPVILHDLPLGSYKVRIEKAGFEPINLNLSLSVNEFNPIIVNLTPIAE